MLPICCFSGELATREKIKDEVSVLFNKNNYNALSELSAKYLHAEERTSSGLWKSGLFYSGIIDQADLKIKDEDHWNNLEQKALEWVKSQPKSPSGYLAYAIILERRAWMYRGGGWAKDVKKEDWVYFRKYIQKAKSFLLKNKRIASSNPQWYDTMISIARAEGIDKSAFDQLITEAIDKFPYYYPIYFSAINYLAPRWHGSKREIENFATKAVNFTKAKEKNGMYARIYWYASQTQYGYKLFTESAVLWATMSKSIDDVLEKYPDQWNINNFAKFSCLARDKSKTKLLISQIKGKPILKAWQNFGFYSRCRDWSNR